MIQNDDSHKTALFEMSGQEKYLLQSPTAIANVLHDLAKKPDIITAYFNRGSEYQLTAVLAVMPERDLVVLDYGADEAMNRRMLASERVVCVTKHDNISIKFTCTNLVRAKFHEHPAFAAPLPKALFRLQRREYFRVITPIIHPVLCHMAIPPGNTAALRVIDMSVGGVALADPQFLLEGTLGQLLGGCSIEMPDFGSISTDLEIRNALAMSAGDNQRVQRVGCAFRNLSIDNANLLQRYIHRLQIQQKALAQP